jgi:acetyltransferase-like isoleucine patch superfamily enzyme
VLKEIIKKYKYDKNSDRLGPDCPFTHWKLYFKKTMTKLCNLKFKQFGKNSEFRVGSYAITCSKISLGDNVIIRPNCMLFADPRNNPEGEIIIEDNVMIGSGVHMYVANHKYDLKDIDIMYQGHYPAENIVLRKGCWIGANSIILPGVIIGENSVVGGGSVVTKSFPARVLIAGNPARIIKYLDKDEHA